MPVNAKPVGGALARGTVVIYPPNTAPIRLDKAEVTQWPEQKNDYTMECTFEETGIRGRQFFRSNLPYMYSEIPKDLKVH